MYLYYPVRGITYHCLMSTSTLKVSNVTGVAMSGYQGEKVKGHLNYVLNVGVHIGINQGSDVENNKT